MPLSRAGLWRSYRQLHDLVITIVARSEPCRRSMAIPVKALSFMMAIDDPSFIRCSRHVPTYLGLTSRQCQSGTSADVQGRLSKAGDADFDARSTRRRRR